MSTLINSSNGNTVCFQTTFVYRAYLISGKNRICELLLQCIGYESHVDSKTF
jgi:hypothetical protein